MKNVFTLLMMFGILSYSFGQEVIVGWDFPDGTPDLIADAGIPENLDKEIATFGETGDIQFKNGFTSMAAQATDWHAGNMTKGWEVSFTTAGYSNLTISSRQSSGGSDPGPRDWMVQYKTDATDWADVPGSGLTVLNDWETGVLVDLTLPESCNDKDLVYLRWVMVSDTSSSGQMVGPSGKTKIDDIYIKGENSSDISDLSISEPLKAWPNPCSGILFLETQKNISEALLFSAAGHLVKSFDHDIDQIDVSSQREGMYILQLLLDDGSRSQTKVLVRR